MSKPAIRYDGDKVFCGKCDTFCGLLKGSQFPEANECPRSADGCEAQDFLRIQNYGHKPPARFTGLTHRQRVSLCKTS